MADATPGTGDVRAGGGPPADEREERRRRLVELFRGAPIVETFGMTIAYDDRERAVVGLPRNPGLDHALGDVHGGVVTTLVDSAAWFTVAPRYPGWISTVDLDVRFLEPAGAGPLRATGELVRVGRRLATARASCRTGDGDLVASATGTFTATSLPTD